MWAGPLSLSHSLVLVRGAALEENDRRARVRLSAFRSPRGTGVAFRESRHAGQSRQWHALSFANSVLPLSSCWSASARARESCFASSGTTRTEGVLGGVELERELRSLVEERVAGGGNREAVDHERLARDGEDARGPRGEAVVRLVRGEGVVGAVDPDPER